MVPNFVVVTLRIERLAVKIMRSGILKSELNLTANEYWKFWLTGKPTYGRDHASLNVTTAMT